MQKFWFVHVEGGGNPKQPYLVKNTAIARAKELAATTRSRVHVLESVLIVSAQVPVAEITYHLETPETDVDQGIPV